MVYVQTYTHTQWNITQPQKNEILSLAVTWMDLENIILSEHTEKDKYITCDIKNNTSESIYKAETDSQKTNLWLVKWKRSRIRMN